jgi:hypothetical protein
VDPQKKKKKKTDLQAHEHMVRKDHRLVLFLDLIAVLTRQHIYLPLRTNKTLRYMHIARSVMNLNFTEECLVHAELAYISLEEEDIRALHTWVHYLRSGEVHALLATHNLRTPARVIT